MCRISLTVSPPLCLPRESQEFVDTFEGALGKGKGQKWFAYKVMMKKVRAAFFFFYFLLPDYFFFDS